MMTGLDASSDLLADWVRDARARTVELVGDLTDPQLVGPRLPTVNPLLWEIGHIAWFHEKWVLRHVAGRGPARPYVDALYDSAAIPHDTRWDLPFPSRRETFAYLAEVHDRVLDLLAGRPLTDELAYFVKLSVFHEDMHTEAFTYTRQTHGFPPPRFELISDIAPSPRAAARGLGGDVALAGGTFLLGASPDEPFVFDNEKWGHPVEVRPFAISRTAVTQGEFAAFVGAGGYRQRAFWSDAGWQWRAAAGAEHPVYWRRDGGVWLRRDFDRWVLLEPDRPVLHVNWHEARAYCRWAGRRLPTEAEWEFAASTSPRSPRAAARGLGNAKRRFPWGDAPPTPERANLDWHAMGTLDVDALPAGESGCGCRQMIGNVWEWTDDDFLPYPGFVLDPYKEYSQPWFGTHKVLRGGCWATRSRLLRNTWRNFYTPDRRDIWAGFRTCAADGPDPTTDGR